MGAVLTLLRTGRYTGVKNVKLWDEEKREWVEKELFSRRVGYVPPNVQPKTLEVINKARTAKNPKEAIKLMRKAIDMEPTCAMAYYNLGVLLSQNGNLVEGETLIFKSVEVDPTYMFGHASIALNEAQADHEIKALEHLKIIEKAEIIDSETAFLENLAWLLLAVNKGDLVAASQRLDMASRINPDHTLLKIYKDLLDSADNEEENIDTFFDDYHIKSSRIIHKKLLKTSLTSQTELAACLEVYSKESLTAIARFVHIRLVGKKTEMLSKLVPCFLNQAFLEQILKSDLHPDEREALKWVLQNNGARLWNDFVEKFSDDYVESPHWLYHEPQSIMGRLRNSGLLHLGTLDDQQVVFIPADLRPFLQSIFKNMQD
jgi:tetratricopeptide (TPR) repeat protein